MYRWTLLSITSSVALLPIVLILSQSASGQTTGIAFESETRIPDQFCAVGDLNNDGLADLASTGWGDRAVHVRFNDGHGFFLAEQSYTIPSFSTSLAVADIDGDGHPDVLVALSNPCGLLVLQNDSAGTGHLLPHFVPVLASGWPFELQVVVGDIDGDGKTDAVLLDEFNGMGATFPNSLGGSLNPIVFPVSIPHTPIGLSLIDVNGDGKLDLICGDMPYSRFDVFLNTGFGVFQPPTYVQCVPYQVEVLACGDLDGDGYPDVLVGPQFYGSLQAFHNLGNGTFASPVTFPGTVWGSCLRITDVDADGVNDIVSGGGDALAVFKGMGGGAFHRPDLYAACNSMSSIDFAPLDGDGHVDIVCASWGEAYVQTFLSKSSGKYSALPFFSTGQPWSDQYPRLVRLADLDADGNLDVITLSSDGFSVRLNRGDASFQTPAVYSVGEYTSGLAVSDIDHDGDEDVVVSSNSGLAGTINVYLNQGDGTFSTPLRFNAPITSGIALGDMDGDGSVDVVLGLDYSGNIPVMHQLHPLQFTFDQALHLNHASRQIALVDLDGDGDLDLIAGAAGNTATGLSVMIDLGHGAFANPVDYSTSQVGEFSCADFDGDGALDLVTTYTSTGKIGVRINRGDGTFLAESQYAVSGAPYAVDCADVDGDQRVDIVVFDIGRKELSALKNAGHGRFRPEVRIPASGNGEIALGDLDGDGAADVVMTDTVLNGFAVQHNLATNGSAFCVGDGSGTACPCGNQSATGANSGCLNSLGLGGHLSGGGLAEVHSDSVVLTSSQMRNGAAVLYQSSTVFGGGAGGVFMDGLRCVGSPALRIGVHNVTSGSTVFPATGEPKLGIAGGIQSSGDVHYQVWYRDPVSFCTPYTANLTNGWTIHWTP